MTPGYERWPINVRVCRGSLFFIRSVVERGPGMLRFSWNGSPSISVKNRSWDSPFIQLHRYDFSILQPVKLDCHMPIIHGFFSQLAKYKNVQSHIACVNGIWQLGLNFVQDMILLLIATSSFIISRPIQLTLILQGSYLFFIRQGFIATLNVFSTSANKTACSFFKLYRKFDFCAL